MGSGLYGMLAFAIVAVFIGGLMVGRTPEYLGKKIEAFEMKMASLRDLVSGDDRSCSGRPIACAACRRARRRSATPARTASARSSTPSRPAPGNNGSAFAGITVSSRSTRGDRDRDVHRPLLADRADPGDRRRARAKKIVPATAGTLPTHGPLFVSLLVGTVVLVGALTFFPALALGPIVEHLQLFTK